MASRAQTDQGDSSSNLEFRGGVRTSDFVRVAVARVDAVQRYAAACSALLAKQRIDAANAYACGSFGCVYPAGPGRVAKVSFDVGEAELGVLFARSRGAHPALPLVYYVARLPNRCGTHTEVPLQPRARKQPPRPLYVVVREDLADIKPLVEPDAIKQLSLLLQEFDFGEDIRGFGNRVDRGVYLLKPYPKALRFYQQGVGFVLWAFERGLHLVDTHLDNWGARGGTQIVLRDFGLANSESMPGPKSIPTLHGLGGMLFGGRRPHLVIRGLRRGR